MKEYIRTFLFIIGALLTKKRKKSKVIYYHDFHDCNKYTDMSTSIDLLKKHIDIAKSLGFKIVRDIQSEYHELAIMLDDGFRGVWDCRNFFYANDIKPTLFIAKSLVGLPGYLTEDEIIELDHKGWNIQSHTVAHTSLNDFDNTQLEYQLEESKFYLENLLNHPIDSICAPQGKFSNKVVEKALQKGYEKFYASTPGYYGERITDFSFVIPRNLCQFLTPFQFRCVLCGGYKLMQRIYLKRRFKKY